tara:strand:- start:9 stop:200 length:192 start_codon:yes stop_codon:yes gene_type:complete
MFGFGKIKCFYCLTKVKKKDAYTTLIDTAEGKLPLQLCIPCGLKMDDMLKELEEARGERDNTI